MELRTLHPLAVFFAAATLLAAAGHCRAEAPSGLPDGSDATPASETELSFRYEEYDELTGAAVDPYIAVRDAYLQYREKRVKE